MFDIKQLSGMATEEKDAEAVSNKAEDSIADSDGESGGRDIPEMEPTVPAAPSVKASPVKEAGVKEADAIGTGNNTVAAFAPGKAGDGKQAGEKTEPARPGGSIKEIKNKIPEKDNKKAGCPAAWEKNCKTDRQAGQKKPDIQMALYRESTAGKTPDAPERKKQQKEAGPDYQKQAATPPRPAKSNLSDISGSQPAQKSRQFGAFPEAAPSGFVGGGIFPSSAFSNLEALRVSFQTDADKKERAGKWNDKDRQTPGIRSKEENTERKPVPAPKPAKIRQQRQTIEKTLSAEKQAAKSAGCEKDAKNQKGRQSDAENSRQVISADNKNQAENIRIETTLSTENDNPVAEVSGVEAATDQLKPDEPNSTHFHGKPDAAASKPDKKSSDSEEPTKNDPKKNTIEAPGDSRQEQTNAGEDKGSPGQEETYKNSSDDMIKQEDSRSTKDHKEPMKQKDKRRQKDPKSKKETRDVKKRAMEAARKLSDKIPADIIEKVPVFSQIAKQQRHTIFVSEEKWFLKQHIPHKQVIINDLIYDTDNSEMFLRVEGQSGMDNPCVHYNYRTQNGNFFRCTVKYKHEDSIRALDIMEAKHMLEEHPALYRKFFPDSVSDA